MSVNITYRTTDIAPIPTTSSVKGSELSYVDLDGNLRSIKVAVDGLLSSLTFDSSGSGISPGTTYSGTTTTVSYNSIGAASLQGTNAVGTWPISISGIAGSVDWANVLNKPANLGGYIDPTTGQLIINGQSVSFSNLAGELASGQIQAGSISATAFAQSIAPVNLFSSLPTTYQGNIVFDTSDGKLYRWNGTSYTSAVNVSDIQGQITGSMIAPGSISVTSLAPGLTLIPTVSTTPTTYDGDIVFNVTQGLLYKWNGTAYVTIVNATDITGQLQAAQIASLAASQITGSLSDSQISAISAAKITGQLVSSQIQDASISVAKFASGLQPVTVVSSVPLVESTATIFNTTDGNLYRWNGSSYTASISATNITGQLQAAQIASLAASQITGQLTASQIASINAAQLTGQITSTQITNNAITTPLLASGAVTAANIAAGTIVASNIAAGTITSTQIAAGTIQAANIAAGTIVASNIASNTITGNQIAANTITATNIAANTITAGQIAAGAITTAQIAAGAITTGQLFVSGRGPAINPDQFFTDTTAWLVSSDVSFIKNGSLASVSGAQGATYVQSTTGGSNGFAETPKFSIDPNQTYKLTANLYAAVGNTRNMFIYVRFFKADGVTEISGAGTTWGGVYGGYIYEGAPPTGQWTTQGGLFGASTNYLIPSAAAYMTIGVWFQYSGNGSGSYLQACQNLYITTAVDNSLIVDGTIYGSKIVANSITAGQIAANTITAGQIASSTITSSQIAAGTIQAANIAAGTILASNIASNTITGNQIAANTITANNIAANTITAGQIAAGTITGNQIAAQTIYAGNLVAGTITSTQIATGTIVASNIAAGTITGNLIAANTIQASSLVANSITAGQIAAGAINTAQIAAGAITSTLIGANTILGNNIAAGTITAANIGVQYLSAISANMGTITAGTLAAGTEFAGTLYVGSSPAISGTTMSGSGAVINSNGTFAIGNSSTNISYNGSTMTLNGNVVATGNINQGAVTQSSYIEYTSPVTYTISNSSGTQTGSPIQLGSNISLNATTTNQTFLIYWAIEGIQLDDSGYDSTMTIEIVANGSVLGSTTQFLPSGSGNQNIGLGGQTIIKNTSVGSFTVTLYAYINIQPPYNNQLQINSGSLFYGVQFQR